MILQLRTFLPRFFVRSHMKDLKMKNVFHVRRILETQRKLFERVLRHN